MDTNLKNVKFVEEELGMSGREYFITIIDRDYLMETLDERLKNEVEDEAQRKIAVMNGYMKICKGEEVSLRNGKITSVFRVAKEEDFKKDEEYGESLKKEVGDVPIPPEIEKAIAALENGNFTFN